MPKAVWRVKGSAPVVPEAKAQKDLRPAVFIKDLKKRSYAIEEEKQMRKKKQEKASDTILTQKLKTEESVVSKLKKAMTKKDLQALTSAIFEAKTKNSGIDQKLIV